MIIKNSKRIIGTLVLAVGIFTAYNAEAQTPAQLRRQIADKERQLNTMQTQFNQKTERAIAFDAQHRPAVQQRANQIMAAEIRNNSLQFWIDSWNPNLSTNVSPTHVELPRRQTEVRRRHIQSADTTLRGSFPEKIIQGSAGGARFEDVESQVSAVARNAQSSSAAHRSVNDFLRDRGRLTHMNITVNRVYCRPSEYARRELQSRIEDTSLAKAALQHQYRVANMSPAERAAYNRARGW